MRNDLTRVMACATVLAGLAAVEPSARAGGQPETVTLKSGFSREWLVGHARQVHLSMTLDRTDSGSGTLTFDPNIHDEWGSTCIAIREVRVQARLVQDDGRDAKGRRLYELRPVGEEGKVVQDGERWFLVRPLKAGAPCSLLFTDKHGKVQDVLLLE